MKTLTFAVSLLAAVSAFAGNPQSSGITRCFAGTNSKLTNIIIPKVDFRNVTVSEAIEFLRQKAKQLDPEGVGVNIVLKLPTEARP